MWRIIVALHVAHQAHQFAQLDRHDGVQNFVFCHGEKASKGSPRMRSVLVQGTPAPAARVHRTAAGVSAKSSSALRSPMVLLLDAASQRSLTPRASSHDDKINSSYSILSEVSTAEVGCCKRGIAYQPYLPAHAPPCNLHARSARRKVESKAAELRAAPAPPPPRTRLELLASSFTWPASLRASRPLHGQGACLLCHEKCCRLACLCLGLGLWRPHPRACRRQTPIATREPPHNDGGDGGCGQGGGRAVKIDQQNKGRRARDGLSDNALVEEDEYYQGLKTYESAALDALLAASTSAQQQAAAVAPCPDAT